MSSTIETPPLLDVLRRRWPLVFVVSLLVGIAAAVFAIANRDYYESTAKLLFRQTIGPEQNAYGLTPTAPDVDKLARDFEQLVESRDVAENTAAALRRRGIAATTEDVLADVRVTGGRDSDVVTIVARARRPERAALLANLYARSAQELAGAAERRAALRLARLVRAELRQAARRRTTAAVQRLSSYLERLELLASGDNAVPRLIQRGYVPTGKAGDPIQTVLLGLIFGAVLGSGLALVREQTDRRLRRSEDVVAAFGAPVLTTLPFSRRLNREGPLGLLDPELAEAFRVLDANLRFTNGRPLSALAICSQGRDEGRSTVAWHLAAAAARSGLRVAVVEADLRRPVLARRHGLHAAPGLLQVLRGQASPLDVLQVAPLSLEGLDERRGSLHVITAGGSPPDPWSLLQSSAIGPVLDVIRGSHDLIVIDTPPLGHYADAVAVVRGIDGVVAVARLGETRLADAARFTGQLQALRVPVFGVVANGGSISGGYSLQPITLASADEESEGAPPLRRSRTPGGPLAPGLRDR